MKTRLAAMAFAGLCLPAYAQAPNSDQSKAQTLKLSPHVWYINGNPNIAIIVGTQATLLVDAGMGPKNGAYIAAEAKRLSPAGNKLYLTTTHYHPEHASGDSGFPAGTVEIRSKAQDEEMNQNGAQMIEAFRGRSDLNRSLLEGARVKAADVVFDGEMYTVDLGGGVAANILWYGAAHTVGDELIWADPDGVLITGDVVQNKTGPNVICPTCTPQKWLAVLDKMEQLNANVVLPDHSLPGDVFLVRAETNFMRDLVNRIKAAKAQGVTVEDAKRTIAEEMQKKYPDWVNLNGIPVAVEKGYAAGG